MTLNNEEILNNYLDEYRKLINPVIFYDWYLDYYLDSVGSWGPYLRFRLLEKVRRKEVKHALTCPK